MNRKALKLALPLALLLVSGCDNGSQEKAPQAAPASSSAPLDNGPLPVVKAADPKPIDMGPLPVPADPAVLEPTPQAAGSVAQKPGEPSKATSPTTAPTDLPSIRGGSGTKTPGPMAPRTPATM